MSGELLKVLYCSFDVIPDPTGTSARATDFVRGITPYFNVDGLTVKSADHSHIERYHGMRLMRVPVGGGDFPARIEAFERAVRRQLESEEYQLAHFTDPFGGYPLCELRQQCSFKLIYEVVGLPSIEVKHTHPHLENDRRLMSKLRRQELYCLMNADAVLVGSEQTAAMVQSLGIPKDRTAVIPVSADVSLYSPISEMAKPDRTPMRLLYLGSQHVWQGLPALLGAVAIASREVQVRLSIVGPQHPTRRLQLEEIVRLRELADRVELLEPVAEEALPKLLSDADVGVAPLEKCDRNSVQGAPIHKIAHYLAAGRPVIASDLPIVREITRSDCALLHQPSDENDLAEKIIALARDPERRVAMGERARAYAREKLQAEDARTSLLRLYCTLLGNTAGALGEPSSFAPTSIGASGARYRDEATQQTSIEGAPEHTDASASPAQASADRSSPKDEGAAPSDGPTTPRGLPGLPPFARAERGEEPASREPTQPTILPAAVPREPAAWTGKPRAPGAPPPSAPSLGDLPRRPLLSEPSEHDPLEFQFQAPAKPAAQAPPVPAAEEAGAASDARVAEARAADVQAPPVEGPGEPRAVSPSPEVPAAPGRAAPAGGPAAPPAPLAPQPSGLAASPASADPLLDETDAAVEVPAAPSAAPPPPSPEPAAAPTPGPVPPSAPCPMALPAPLPIAGQARGSSPLATMDWSIPDTASPPGSKPSVRLPVPPAAASPPASSPPPPAVPRPSARTPSTAPAPVEIDSSDIVDLPGGGRPHTLRSGLSPPDEWLGHVLLGYAPFGVRAPRRIKVGEPPSRVEPASTGSPGPATPKR